MSFPNWTLWGMGLSALGALVAISLSLIAQSPRLAQRFNLYDDVRLGERVRALTGYALALLLLTFGFFLAGVPLDSGVDLVNGTPTVTMITTTPEESGAAVTDVTLVLTTPPPTNTPGTPVSGAFAAPLPRPATVTATFDATQSASATNRPPTITATPQPSATANALGTPAPTATSTSPPTSTASPTATPSPTPTITPTATITPTPVTGKTATIDTRGSTLWLRRTPGGTPLIILQDRDTVLILSGHANQAGVIWQEISTLDGTAGWVRREYLTLTP